MTETQASAIGSAPVKKLFLLLCLALLSYPALVGVARAESRGLLLSPSALPAASQRALRIELLGTSNAIVRRASNGWLLLRLR